MKVVDAIGRMLEIEGAEFLSAYPTTAVIGAARLSREPVPVSGGAGNGDHEGVAGADLSTNR